MKTKEIFIDLDDLAKVVHNGTLLSPEQEVEFVYWLRENRDMFTWEASDMHGVPRDVVEHSLNVLKDGKPVMQHLRHFGEDGTRKSARR